jgi:hypothetical protein
MRQAPRSKYHAVPTVVDGVRFASKAEARRYGELKMLEKAGDIFDLQLQPEFELCAWQNGNSPVVGKYRADFSYLDVRARKSVVEDVKGMDTQLSKWKRKHMKCQYGIDVQIVK